MQQPTAPKGSAVRTFIKSLERMGVEYAGAINGGAGGKWACPIHDDAHPSLDVTVGRNGKPIFNCKPCHEAMGQENFAGALRDAGVQWHGEPCSPDDVDWGEASVYTRPSPKKGSKGEVRLTEVYQYQHADGTPNFKVKRYDPIEGSEARKHFVPMRMEEGSGYVTGLEGVERTPLYLDKFEEWAGGPIYLVEGEKAARRLLEAGKPVTTFHGGTAGKVEPDWVTRYGFDRFSAVRLWPDADEAGVQRMQNLAADLDAEGVSVSFWGRTDVEAKDDAWDVLERGQTPSRLRDGDLDTLAAMHRMPRRRTTTDAAPADPNAPKALIGATALSGGPVVTDEDDEPEPYLNSIGKRSWAFTREVIDRHFRLEDGTLMVRTHYDDRQVWLWDTDHYVEQTDDQMQARIGELLEGAVETTMLKDGPVIRPVDVSSPKTAEVLRCLRLQTITAKRGRKALKPAEGGVPFRNGWLDVATGLLEPLTPDRDVRWVVEADYDENAECPEWLKFLDSIGFTDGSDARRVLQQWQGYVLSGATDIDKGMLLVGPRRSGKGTILNVCSALLGDGAVGIQLDSFATNFGMQNLIGKGLATIGDARFGLRTDKSVIERLLSLTGFDTMQIDVKHGKPMSVRLPTRLMVGTNETPKFIEASDALAGRFLILAFVHSFYGREDLGLKHRVLAELPGIARWALDGYRDLRAQGFFTETKEGLELQSQMIRDAAPIRVFVDEECVIGVEEWDESQDLFDAYLRWAERANTYKMDRSGFFRDLNTAFPGKIESFKKRVGGVQVQCKRGIRVRASR